MSPLRRHTPRSRDNALDRRRTMVTTATIGGLTAVGVITGALAVSAAQSSASTPSASPSDTAPSDGSQSGALQDPGGSSSGFNPPVNAPALPQGGRGGGFQAITGGSGHH